MTRQTAKVVSAARQILIPKVEVIPKKEQSEGGKAMLPLVAQTLKLLQTSQSIQLRLTTMILPQASQIYPLTYSLS